MNIFVLHHDPVKAVRMACDQHLTKMLVEYGQMLSTAHRVMRPEFADRHDLYRKTHTEHRCNRWIRDDDANYRWLYRAFCEHIREYHRRYKKFDTYQRLIALRPWLEYSPQRCRTKREPKGFVLAMDKYPECQSDDPVESYRRFYIVDKSKFARWSFTDPPKWYTSGLKEFKRGKPIGKIIVT